MSEYTGPIASENLGRGGREATKSKWEAEGGLGNIQLGLRCCPWLDFYSHSSIIYYLSRLTPSSIYRLSGLAPWSGWDGQRRRRWRPWRLIYLVLMVTWQSHGCECSPWPGARTTSSEISELSFTTQWQLLCIEDLSSGRHCPPSHIIPNPFHNSATPVSSTILSLQKMKLRLRENKWLAWECTRSKPPDWDLVWAAWDSVPPPARRRAVPGWQHPECTWPLEPGSSFLSPRAWPTHSVRELNSKLKGFIISSEGGIKHFGKADALSAIKFWKVLHRWKEWPLINCSLHWDETNISWAIPAASTADVSASSQRMLEIRFHPKRANRLCDVQKDAPGTALSPVTCQEGILELLWIRSHPGPPGHSHWSISTCASWVTPQALKEHHPGEGHTSSQSSLVPQDSAMALPSQWLNDQQLTTFLGSSHPDTCILGIVKLMHNLPQVTPSESQALMLFKSVSRISKSCRKASLKHRWNNHINKSHPSGSSHWSSVYSLKQPNLQMRKLRHQGVNDRGLEAPQPLPYTMSTFWFLEAMQSGPQSQVTWKKERKEGRKKGGGRKKEKGKKNCWKSRPRSRRRGGRKRVWKEIIRDRAREKDSLPLALPTDVTIKRIGLPLSPWCPMFTHWFNQSAFLR